MEDQIQTLAPVSSRPAMKCNKILFAYLPLTTLRFATMRYVNCEFVAVDSDWMLPTDRMRKKIFATITGVTGDIPITITKFSWSSNQIWISKPKISGFFLNWWLSLTHFDYRPLSCESHEREMRFHSFRAMSEFLESGVSRELWPPFGKLKLIRDCHKSGRSEWSAFHELIVGHWPSDRSLEWWVFFPKTRNQFNSLLFSLEKWTLTSEWISLSTCVELDLSPHIIFVIFFLLLTHHWRPEFSIMSATQPERTDTRTD